MNVTSSYSHITVTLDIIEMLGICKSTEMIKNEEKRTYSHVKSKLYPYSISQCKNKTYALPVTGRGGPWDCETFRFP
jgi:hypothetical protein